MMRHLAEQVVFPIRPDLQAVERRVADTDNGYTRIANELLEAITRSGMTRNQLLIALAIIRKTYGYNKTADWIGNAQLAELTGLPITRCSTERNKLIKMNILQVKGRVVGINKEVSSWQTRPKGNNKTFIGSVTLTGSVKEIFTEAVNRSLPDRLNTKDNTTKDNKDSDHPLREVKNSPSQVQRATPRASNFSPSLKHHALAEQLGIALQNEFAGFCDYHDAKGSLFKNWDAALNTWLRSAASFRSRIAKSGTGKLTPAATRITADNFSAKNYGTSEVPDWVEK